MASAKTRILELLAIAGPIGVTGSQIARVCHTWLGTSYVALNRLELDGHVVSEFDDEPYPRQRRYWLKTLRPSAADTSAPSGQASPR